MSAAAQHSALTPESWEDLFDFLDPARHERQGPDRDGTAILKCAEIKRKLVCFFLSRHCADAEDLAVETTLRVAAKCRDLGEIPETQRAAYFYGVARNVLHEWARSAQRESAARDSLLKDPTLVARRVSSPRANIEWAHRCLERCISGLTGRSKRLILSYYDTGHNTVECHRTMADEFGTSTNGLRIQAHRIRKVLRQCVMDCVRHEGVRDERRHA